MAMMYPLCIHDKYIHDAYIHDVCIHEIVALFTIYAFVRDFFVKLLSRNVFWQISCLYKYLVIMICVLFWVGEVSRGFERFLRGFWVFLFEWERFRKCCKQRFGKRFGDFWSGRWSSTNIYFQIWGHIYVWQDFNK